MGGGILYLNLTRFTVLRVLRTENCCGQQKAEVTNLGFFGGDNRTRTCDLLYVNPLGSPEKPTKQWHF